MARPKRFELLTPRFVVWWPTLKSLRLVTERIDFELETPFFGIVANAAVTESVTGKGLTDDFTIDRG